MNKTLQTLSLAVLLTGDLSLNTFGMNFRKDTDEVLLARMIFGEARSCSLTEQIAIGYTAVNRATDGKNWNGTTLKDAILKKRQYSCFNSNDPNLPKLSCPEKYGPKSFERCLWIARNILDRKFDDPTLGATHYHTKKTRADWEDSPKMVKLYVPDFYEHFFFKEI